MTGAAVAVTVAQFQAAWYYSIVVAALFFVTLYGGVWAVRGAVRVWRSGDAPAGFMLGVSAVTAVLIMVGLVMAGAFGLHSMFQGG